MVLLNKSNVNALLTQLKREIEFLMTFFSMIFNVKSQHMAAFDSGNF